MARYPPLIGGGFLYGGLAAAYHRHRRRPESRADKKHRTEFAPLLVQEFGRDRNSRSSRLGNPEDTAAGRAHWLTLMESSFLFYKRKIGVPFSLKMKLVAQAQSRHPPHAATRLFRSRTFHPTARAKGRTEL